MEKDAADIGAEAGDVCDQKIMNLPGFLMAHGVERKRVKIINLSPDGGIQIKQFSTTNNLRHPSRHRRVGAHRTIDSTGQTRRQSGHSDTADGCGHNACGSSASTSATLLESGRHP
jgi:hypothetical protein